MSPDGPRQQQTEAAVRDIGMTPFARSIDPADRRALARDLRQRAEPLRRNREEIRVRFAALLAALRSETFDGSEVASLLALQRSAAITRQEIGEEILIDYLSGLSVEDRRAYADRLEASVRRTGPGRRGQDNSDRN